MISDQLKVTLFIRRRRSLESIGNARFRTKAKIPLNVREYAEKHAVQAEKALAVAMSEKAK